MPKLPLNTPAPHPHRWKEGNKPESGVSGKEHSSMRADTTSYEMDLMSKPLSHTFLEDDINEYDLEKVTPVPLSDKFL